VKRLVPVLALLAALLAASTAFAADKKASPSKADEAKPAVVDSLGLLERAVAKDSTNFGNLYKLGVMLLDRDRVSEASRVLMKAHQIDPKDVPTTVNIGVAYDQAGSAWQAQKYYDEALAMAPDDSVALCRKVWSVYGQGKYDDAMQLFRQIVARHPRAYCAYYTLGVAFADAGLYRDAIRQWQKVIEIAPTSAEAINARESIDVLEKFLATPAQPAKP
jgi:tetratricopeptide (TPR) repeat protein